MSDEIESRVEKLEVHVTELERQMEQLNEVIIAQGRAVEKAMTQLRRIVETVENQELERIKDTNPKPPHYQ